jgi:hypothetical protein
MGTRVLRWSPARDAVGLSTQLVLGLALIAVAWPLAWAGPAPFSEHTFFPLWLGYILTVDGLVLLRSGTSLLTRSAGRFALLFVFSIPVWWLFELANEFLGNWRYVMPRDRGPVAYAALASLSFSTVIPALFETAELYRTLPPFRRPIRWLRVAPSRAGLRAIAAAGLAMFALSLVVPGQAFPLVWIGLFLFLDPINRLTGGRSLAAQAAVRRWDTVLVLFAAGLTCGFFWEMWNWRSMPKWVYEVPYADGAKLFEMPLLGYGGYLPFALEIYAVYHLLHTLLFRAPDAYLRLDDAVGDAGRATTGGGRARPQTPPRGTRSTAT